ncbi:MAG: PEP-CTERM sorting domain-containing protein [Verrucomicrobiales bacterium]|nr:PEP-CTERM sorting domain-containing protein [Verrucomicrobiales bacterium]
MKLPILCVLPMALLAPSARATVLFTGADYIETFSVVPITGDWITSTSIIAGDANTFTSVATLDTFITTFDASGLTTAFGTSATNPPSAHALARQNTTLLVGQMRATGKGANVMVLRMQNTSGGTIPNLYVSYDFGVPVAGTEELPGWQAYYSTSGNGGWTKIPSFSTAVPGNLQATLDFGGGGWADNSLVHILWVDDNAVAGGTEEGAYTIDNVLVSTVPEPASLAGIFGGLALLSTRRRRANA